MSRKDVFICDECDTEEPPTTPYSGDVTLGLPVGWMTLSCNNSQAREFCTWRCVAAYASRRGP